MSKIPVDIISGFLGAGKTTLIRKLLNECYQDQKIFLLENEYGQVGIDGSLLANQNIELKEIYSGCICCSLKGDFTRVLLDALDKVKPQRIVIEPTGVGKLSEIISVVEQDIFRNKLTTDYIGTVVDAQKALVYLKNFGEFFKDQVKYARTLILSKAKGIKWHTVQELIQALRPLNPAAMWVTTPWEELTGQQILRANTSKEALLIKDLPSIINMRKVKNTCGYHKEVQQSHQHNHNCGCPQHSHIHSCGSNYSRHQHHSHNHSASAIFQDWSWESPKIFKPTSLQRILSSLVEETKYGRVLRAKGIVPGENEWIHFEYVSGNWNIVGGTPQLTGRAVVIGVNLKKDQLNQLFEGKENASC